MGYHAQRHHAVSCLGVCVAQRLRYSAENSSTIFIRGGEPWLMGYCWRTPYVRFFWTLSSHRKYRYKNTFHKGRERTSILWDSAYQLLPGRELTRFYGEGVEMNIFSLLLQRLSARGESIYRGQQRKA